MMFCAALMVTALVHPNAAAQVPSPPNKDAVIQANVTASKALALKKYPDLAKAGTELNRAFVERSNKLRAENPDFFKDSGWPMKLADEIASTKQLTVTATTSPDVAAARDDAPFINTLEMKFVPVPMGNKASAGQHVIFSIWETRVRDYEMFVKAEEAAGRKVDGNWKTASMNGVPVGQELNHPVVRVVRTEAEAFCRWLTEKGSSRDLKGGFRSHRQPEAVRAGAWHNLWRRISECCWVSITPGKWLT